MEVRKCSCVVCGVFGESKFEFRIGGRQLSDRFGGFVPFSDFLGINIFGVTT